MKAVEITYKKNNKEKLSYDEIKYMVNSYVKNKISDSTMSEFLWAIYYNGLSIEETYSVTSSVKPSAAPDIDIIGVFKL